MLHQVIALLNPVTKLWEGNVFQSRLSTGVEGPRVIINHDALVLTVQWPPAPSSPDTPRHRTSMYGYPRPDMFKLVHNEARIVGNQVVCILLEYLSVADLGGRRGREPNSFDFMQFLGNFGKIVCWRPPPPRGNPGSAAACVNDFWWN